MIYVTGDTHRDIDIHKLANWCFPAQKSLTRDDYLIVCGDFGLVWDGGIKDLYWQQWLEQKNFTTLFVSGNHENFELLLKYPVTEWHGGKVQFIQQHIIHLMRGQVYDIDGLKVFTMGGAASHDMWCRTEGISWWPQEMPSSDEYEEAKENLQAANWNVDVVLTHCGPNTVQNYVGCGTYGTDKLTDFLEEISHRLTWKKWYMGHYHRDETLNNYHMLYNNIVELTPRYTNESEAKKVFATRSDICDWCEDTIDHDLDEICEITDNDGNSIVMHKDCAIEYSEELERRL